MTGLAQELNFLKAIRFGRGKGVRRAALENILWVREVVFIQIVNRAGRSELLSQQEGTKSMSSRRWYMGSRSTASVHQGGYL